MIYPEVILNMLIALAIYEVYRVIVNGYKSRAMAEKLMGKIEFLSEEEMKEKFGKDVKNEND
jgi:hypothetical protein